MDASRPIQWVGGFVPKAEPACGFFGEKCERALDWRLLAVTAFVALTALVAAIFLLKSVSLYYISNYCFIAFCERTMTLLNVICIIYRYYVYTLWHIHSL